MKVAAIQSNYLPWKGYFDIINSVDLFVFYDDVQYTVKDWRNRNRIKTLHGPKWLTVPCSSSRNQLICEVEISDSHWQKKHWKSLIHNYRKAPYFEEYAPLMEEIYIGRRWKYLSELNQYLIRKISADILHINTRFEDSRQYRLQGVKEDRVLDLLYRCGATSYVSGPSAKAYIQEERFAKAGIDLIWMDYSGYPEYDQLYPPFEHQVSIIDLIFNEGPRACEYMLSFNRNTPSP